MRKKTSDFASAASSGRAEGGKTPPPKSSTADRGIVALSAAPIVASSRCHRRALARRFTRTPVCECGASGSNRLYLPIQSRGSICDRQAATKRHKKCFIAQNQPFPNPKKVKKKPAAICHFSAHSPENKRSLSLQERKQRKVATREQTNRARGDKGNAEEAVQKEKQSEIRANEFRKKQNSTPYISASKHKKKDSNELQKEKKFLPLQANEPPTSQKTHRSFLFTLKF